MESWTALESAGSTQNEEQALIQNRRQTIGELTSQMVVVAIHDLAFLDCPADILLAELIGQIEEMNVGQALGCSLLGLKNCGIEDRGLAHLTGVCRIPGTADGPG